MDTDIVQAAPSVPLEIRYKRLKRKYYNLEAKLHQAELQLQRATEQNVRLKQERDNLLDRLIDIDDPQRVRPDDIVLNEASLLSVFLGQVSSDRRKSSAHHLQHALIDNNLRNIVGEANSRASSTYRHLTKPIPAKAATKRRSRSHEADDSGNLTRAADGHALDEVGITSNGPTGFSTHSPTRSVSASSTPPFERFLKEVKPQSLAPPSASLRRGTDPSSSSIQRATKPKRLKASNVQSKSFSIPTIPRDPVTKKPLLPLTVGIITIINLGQIFPQRHYHTERYIFPVGYEVIRKYLSTKDPSAEVTYTCKILSNGDSPVFHISAPDLDPPVVAGTATGAWSGIVRAANLIRKRTHSNSVSGPEYFGLGQNTIKCLIQELDGAHQLSDYVWQNYIEGGPLVGRHAPVTHTQDASVIPSSSTTAHQGHLPPPPLNHFYAPDGTLILLPPYGVPPFPGCPSSMGIPPLLGQDYVHEDSHLTPVVQCGSPQTFPAVISHGADLSHPSETTSTTRHDENMEDESGDDH
ncbi:hypothetical protein FRC02_009032 [Tulasnella sp. 418]|nr:hypothetical protein FRC02_009032 [Tulasnella sp. 418]